MIEIMIPSDLPKRTSKPIPSECFSLIRIENQFPTTCVISLNCQAVAIQFLGEPIYLIIYSDVLCNFVIYLIILPFQLTVVRLMFSVYHYISNQLMWLFEAKFLPLRSLLIDLYRMDRCLNVKIM